jgi:hypothetical protein
MANTSAQLTRSLTQKTRLILTQTDQQQDAQEEPKPQQAKRHRSTEALTPTQNVSAEHTQYCQSSREAFKDAILKIWLGKEFLEPSNPYGFSSAGNSRTVSRHASRASSPMRSKKIEDVESTTGVDSSSPSI